MGNSSGANVFDDDLHLRIIGKTSILLLKPKMCGVKMHDERRGGFRVLLKNVGCGFDCNGNDSRRSVIIARAKALHGCMQEVPYRMARNKFSQPDWHFQ